MRPTLLLVAILLLAGCAAPLAPFAVEQQQVGAALEPLQAGVGVVEFTPETGAETGYPIGGYGHGARRREWPFLFGGGIWGRLSLDLHQAWHGDDPDPESRADFLEPARGVHDPLRAKALVLDGGGSPLALVRIDAAVGSQDLNARVAELVADLPISSAGLIIAATHTHSGVGCTHRSRFARLAALDNYRPEVFERIAQACAEAIRLAWTSRRPAVLSSGNAFDRGPDGAPRLVYNRRSDDFDAVDPDDVDPEVGFLRVLDGEGEPLACVLNFAVHPTVLGTDNLYFSGDVVAAMEREVSARLGGEALFFNGAVGDISPRGGAGGLERCRELARTFADAVVPAIQAAEPGSDRVAVDLASGTQAFGDPFLFFAAGPGGRRAFLEADDHPVARAAAFPFGLPVNAILWALGVFHGRFALNVNGTLGLRFDLTAYTDRTAFPFHAVRVRGSSDDVVFMTLPGEAFHDLGERLKEAGRAAGASQPFVLGLANGAMMYLAGPESYFQGGYEAMVTLFGPETEPRAERAARQCLEAVYRPAAK